MNPAIASIVVAVVAVVGGIAGAGVSAWLNRDKDDADTAAKISAAWDPVFKRYDDDMARVTAKCDKCENELGNIKKAVRVWLRARDSGDESATEAAVAAARELVS